MDAFEDYKRMLKAIEEFRFQNNSVLEQVRSSMKILDTLDLIKSIENTAKKYSEMFSIQGSLAKLEEFYRSPALDMAREANLSISRLFSAGHIEEMLKERSRIHSFWQDKLVLSEFKIPKIDFAQLELQSQFAKISEISIFAESMLATLDLEKIANRFNITQDLQATFRNTFLDFNESYFHLLKSFEALRVNILSFPPSVTCLPPIEFCNGVLLAKQIFSHRLALIQQEEPINREIAKEAADSLEQSLGKINPLLIRLWKGAIKALDSQNPDRVRHFITSLRELFTQVLHRLAPDEQVRQWNSSPDYYQAGKPTRKARLLYICRDINYEPFSQFLEKDIDSVLACIDLFQEGTHAVLPPFDDSQLSSIKIRTESCIRFLLEVGLKQNARN